MAAENQPELIPVKGEEGVPFAYIACHKPDSEGDERITFYDANKQRTGAFVIADSAVAFISIGMNPPLPTSLKEKEKVKLFARVLAEKPGVTTLSGLQYAAALLEQKNIPVYYMATAEDLNNTRMFTAHENTKAQERFQQRN